MMQGKGEGCERPRQFRRSCANYEGETPGVKANLCRMLMEGKLGGTGKMIILPVDQGFEHGPARTFAANPPAYDPHYHYQLAIDAGLSAYAAPLGMLEAGADTFAGQIPTILKVNSANSLMSETAGQEPGDHRLGLGRAAAGMLRPSGSRSIRGRMPRSTCTRRSARCGPRRPRSGSRRSIWSYPRGEAVTKDGETAIDVCAYGAQIAALLGAHIIKIKLSTDHLMLPEAKKVYEAQKIDIKTQAARVRHCMEASFGGRRIVVFSGGAIKGEDCGL